MNWTAGTWADVAIGDDVLGADGYAWSVTNGLINYFGPSGKGESLQVTMEREPIGARTGDVLASKPVKFAESEGVRRLISCVYCLRSDVEEPCKLHAPEPATISVERESIEDALENDRCGICGSVDHFREDHPAPAAVEPADDPSSFEQEEVITATVDPKPVAPYVEYDDAERAAAVALKGAGFTMTVIERVMTLDELTQHIGEVHGEPLPGAGGNLTRIEVRSKLADMHFILHEADQARGRKWEPRGRTPHVHPVMDRPMEDAEPKRGRIKA